MSEAHETMTAFDLPVRVFDTEELACRAADFFRVQFFRKSESSRTPMGNQFPGSLPQVLLG